MHIRIYTYTYTCTPAYTRTQTQANERNVQEQTPTPARPLHRNSSFHPPPRKPFAYQLAIPIPTRTDLINKLAYSHECHPLLTEVPPLSLISRTLSLTNVSPSHPHSPHRQASQLPEVLSPPNRSTAPLFSLSHSFTNQRFFLAPTFSRL
jgi:hypothetical protein